MDKSKLAVPEYADKLKDRQGRYRTQSLFHELIQWNTRQNYEPLYTLAEEDGKFGLPSARQIYLQAEDPTEYEAAMALVGSWDHWQKLMGNEGFMDYLKEWREELEILLTSKSLKKINDIARSDAKDARMAAQFLATKGWESKAGRPSKKKINEQARKIAEDKKSYEEDYARVINIKDKR